MCSRALGCCSDPQIGRSWIHQSLLNSWIWTQMACCSRRTLHHRLFSAQGRRCRPGSRPVWSSFEGCKGIGYPSRKSNSAKKLNRAPLLPQWSRPKYPWTSGFWDRNRRHLPSNGYHQRRGAGLRDTCDNSIDLTEGSSALIRFGVISCGFLILHRWNRLKMLFCCPGPLFGGEWWIRIFIFIYNYKTYGFSKRTP